VSLFPVFLKLKRRRCLVVGAGMVAEAKVRSLLEVGAIVHVVGPQATETLKQWARDGKLVWHARSFQPSDLEGMFLVVVATSSRQLNKRVYQEAARRRVLCNVVDDPACCDFYYGAVVRCGPLQIAISTSGCSPALAQRLKRELEKQFGPKYGAWVEQLGETRRRLLARTMDPKRRQRLLHHLASGEGYLAFVRSKAGKRGAESVSGALQKRQ
jgi:precorrin-2 dehydrogenase/sirohydrochlorin ferrochelatase